MKTYFITFLLMITAISYAHDGENFVAADMLKSMQPGDKAAIVMVYFGSTHDDTRALTIDALTKQIRDTFSSLEVREAYTSRIVRRRLHDRGIDKPAPLEVLRQLKTEGFTHLVIQSANIIEGVEMEALRREVATVASDFKEIRIGTPLLYMPEDYAAVIRALAPAPAADAAEVWVGHGSYDPATAQYAMLGYMLAAEGHTRNFVTTVEGYPAFDDLRAKLKQSGVRSVTLRPFMFVAGDHAKNDIATTMKQALEKEGYRVSMLMEGLGQNAAIRQLYLAHIRFALNHRMTDILMKKKHYETNDPD